MNLHAFFRFSVLLPPLIVATTLHGMTFNVANADVTTLKNDIVQANGNGQNDVINLAANGTYTVLTVHHTDSDTVPNGLPAITADNGHSLTINGNGSTLSRDSAAPLMRLLAFSGANVTVNDLTITNAAANFTANTPQGGGAISSVNSTLTLNDCTLTTNSIKGAHGIDNFDCGNDPICTPKNGVNSLGGALRCSGGSVTLVNCTFTGNKANGGDGGTGFAPGNQAGGDGGSGLGGAIHSQSCLLTVNSCTFTGNSGMGGTGGAGGGAGGPGANGGSTAGAIFLDADTAAAQLDKVVFSSNSAGSAGGVFITSGSDAGVLVKRCTFSTNTGTFGTGALRIAGPTTVERSTFAGNTTGPGASAWGGAIATDKGTLAVANCTFYNNSAGGTGGAIINGNDKTTLHLTNCTLSNNNASGANAAGGVDNKNNDAVVFVSNNIFQLGTSGVNLATSNTLNFNSLGHNISDDAAGGDAGTGVGGLLVGPGDRRNTNPELATAAPQDNGGPTETFDLLANSPAIDQADGAQAPHRDQRGYLRHGPADIGAVEYNGDVLRVVSITQTGPSHHDITLSCEVVEGFTYQLQRKVSLGNATTWQDLLPSPGLIAVDDDTESVTDMNVGSLTTAFYRAAVVGNP